MSALSDLKKLVFVGFLEKQIVLELDVPGDLNTSPPVPPSKKQFTFLLRTLTMMEELAALERAGLDSAPESGKDLIKYILGMLAHAIKKINNEDVEPTAVYEVLVAVPATLVGQLWSVYRQLEDASNKAGTELKN